MEVQENVQLTSQNSCQFKKAYNELLSECIQRRKKAGFSQAFMADWMKVERRKIIELEAGNGGVGLLLNYADRLDVETDFRFVRH